MIRVRILHPTTARLDLAPGDEFSLQAMTPTLRAFLDNTRVDGSRVAEILVDEDEAAVMSPPAEAAVVRSRRSTRTTVA